jgi:hypothetical protein
MLKVEGKQHAEAVVKVEGGNEDVEAVVNNTKKTRGRPRTKPVVEKNPKPRGKPPRPAAGIIPTNEMWPSVLQDSVSVVGCGNATQTKKARKCMQYP